MCIADSIISGSSVVLSVIRGRFDMLVGVGDSTLCWGVPVCFVGESRQLLG